MNIVGRTQEIEELERLYNADNSEFVAVYGRRRVGKTYLIKEVFKDRFAFWHTGLSPYDRDKKFLLRDQLQTFFYSLQDYGLRGEPCPKSWFEAFRLLEKLLEQKDNGEKLVVFIDEMPWMDTARSRFIPAFEHFWNGWAAKRDNILLIVCGSATSWIDDNILNSKGGLYNRLHREIKLRPFTLAESEEYFRSKGIAMSRYDVAQTYMVLGGIPHYLSLFEKGFSAAQNIDRLFFENKAMLEDEFDRLFGSLFKNADDHKKIVRFLSRRRGGYTRKEILEHTGIQDGGGASEMLKGLEASDFVTSYYPFGERKTERYRLSDPFCLFWLQFVDGTGSRDVQFWRKNAISPQLNVWRGLAFEELCFSHIAQIKRKLGIAGVCSSESSWLVVNVDKKQQMDMLIDRADNVVNLCEIKFYGKPFVIDKSYDIILRERVQTLMDVVPHKKSIHLTMIVASGLKQNEYSGQVQNVVTLDDLFV